LLVGQDRLLSSATHDRTRTHVPWLRKPGERAPAAKLICIYARYSTDEQKKRSIERQLEGCSAYYRPKLGADTHVLFQDRGFSGALLAERPGLMELLELVKAGFVSDIIVENFDRLSRDIWDASIIGELLEVYGVKLHLVNLGRAVSRSELMEEAKRAEADRARRTELLSDGINELIRNGGMPWRKNFGYKPGAVRGFPVICEKSSPAVVRLFELAQFGSDREVAEKLEAEKYLSPNGTTRWTNSQVRAIWSNLIYIGVINYRKTNHVRKRVRVDDEPAPVGELRVKARMAKTGAPRSGSEWIVGYNSAYQIVPDELFQAVVMARGFRPSDGKKRRVKADDEDLFEHPICDCPGRDPDQKFVMSWEPPAIYMCSRDLTSADCLCRVGHRILIEDVQRAVLGIVVKHAKPLCEDTAYRADLLKELQVRSDGNEIKRADLIDQRDDLERQANNLLREGAKLGFNDDRWKGIGAELELQIANLSSDIGGLPRIDPESVDVDDAALTLSEAFSVIQGELPFRPQTNSELEVSKKMHSLIKRVVVERDGLPVGRVGIEVTFDLEGYVFGLPGSEESLITERKEIRVQRRFVVGTRTRTALEELAASGTYGLTDEQWILVGSLLPDMSVSYGNVREVMETRRVADAAVFKFRTGAGYGRLPTALGDPSVLAKLVRRFIYAGGMVTLVDVLGARQPDWLEDVDVQSVRRWRTGLGKRRSWAILRPEQAAATHAGDGSFNITDEQWLAVKHLVDPSILQAKGRRAERPFGARRLLDGIILKLRTHCAFNRMPREWGGRYELLGATTALVRTGAWASILDVWRRRFPDLVDGLPVHIIDALGQQYRTEHAKSAAAFERGRINHKKIYANLEKLIVANIARAESVICRKGVRVCIPVRRHLRPDLVVGPKSSLVGADFRQPTLIVRTTNWRTRVKDRRKTLEYRSAKGAEHILMVYSDRVEIEHFQKVDGRWISNTLKQADAVSISVLGLSLPLGDIYAGTET
jgi:DNA invertase Pin-like site-specific DNA recombinase/transposase